MRVLIIRVALFLWPKLGSAVHGNYHAGVLWPKNGQSKVLAVHEGVSGEIILGSCRFTRENMGEIWHNGHLGNMSVDSVPRWLRV